MNVRKVLSISLVSSFGQLSAEYCGRYYGDGLLKHEPSEAEAIRVIMPTSVRERAVAGAFNRINDLLQAGKGMAARLEADRFLVSVGAMSEWQSRSIRAALNRVRALRWQHRAEK